MTVAPVRNPSAAVVEGAARMLTEETDMTTDTGHLPPGMRWERDDASRVPFMTYTDEALYREELERFFYRGHWCYVGLEAEVP